MRFDRDFAVFMLRNLDRNQIVNLEFTENNVWCFHLSEDKHNPLNMVPDSVKILLKIYLFVYA